MLEHKQFWKWHSQDLTRKSVAKKLDEQTVVFIVAVKQI